MIILPCASFVEENGVTEEMLSPAPMWVALLGLPFLLFSLLYILFTFLFLLFPIDDFVKRSWNKRSGQKHSQICKILFQSEVSSKLLLYLMQKDFFVTYNAACDIERLVDSNGVQSKLSRLWLEVEFCCLQYQPSHSLRGGIKGKRDIYVTFLRIPRSVLPFYCLN